MNINKELLNTRLTRQGVQNQRARLANLSSQCGRLLEGVINHSMLCEQCQSEFDPATLNKTVLDTIKLVYSKTLPDITPEDFDTAANEPKSRDDILLALAQLLSDDKLIADVVLAHPEAGKQCKDVLDKMYRLVTVSHTPDAVM